MSWQERLIKYGITLNQTGRQTCPECSANRTNKTEKCLVVSFDSDAVLYNCHNCGWNGAVFYRDKDEKAKKKFNRPVLINLKDNKQSLYDYFQKRGISQETIDKYKIEINDKKEIIFPYYKDNELVNIKYRTNLGKGKKAFRQEAETEKTFFGMDFITDFNQLRIVEGEIDVLSLSEIGIEAVSVPQGGSEVKLECIENCYDWLQKFSNYIIAVDNDDTGDKLKANLLARLEKFKCSIVQYGRFKDANEALTSEFGGKEALLEIINNPEPIKSENITNFNDEFDAIFDFYHNGYSKGYSTGWQSLDELFTIKTGYLMIVTGIPSRGKSFFIDNMLYNLSVNDDLKHFVCSFENSDANHFARLASFRYEQRFNVNSFTAKEFDEAFSFISTHFYRAKLDSLWNIDKIIEETECAVRRYGVKTLTIDPYNRLDNSTTEREDKYIGGMLSKLAMTAKRLNILIIFIAHPKKLTKDEKEPTMYSISGSSDWYNMADYGIILDRKRLEDGTIEDKLKVIVAKVKDFNLGNPSGGEIYLEYEKTRHKILDTLGTYGNYKRS